MMAGSPFSDFEDMLYDADPEPDLVDDLAEHTVHSPPTFFQDDGDDDDIAGVDMGEYYSDWEYYSDDYWDDDPALLKKPTRTSEDNKGRKGGTARTNGTVQEPKKRGRKRNISEVDDTTTGIDLGERKRLKDCIKGTVWAAPRPERQNWYKQGDQQKVALLKDWQQKFGIIENNDKSEKPSKPPMRRDESWANEMSLADMGLMASRGDRLDPEDAEEDGVADVVEDNYDGEEGEDGNNEFLEVEDITELAREQVLDAHENADPKSRSNNIPDEDESDTGSVRRKRRKKNAFTSLTHLAEAATATKRVETTTPLPPNHIDDVSPELNEDPVATNLPDQSSKTTAPGITNQKSVRGRKRKAPEDEPIPEGKSMSESNAVQKRDQETYDMNNKPMTRRRREPINKVDGTNPAQSITNGTSVAESNGETKQSNKKIKKDEGSQEPTERLRRSARSTRNSARN